MSCLLPKRPLATAAAPEGGIKKQKTTASVSSTSVDTPERQQLLDRFKSIKVTTVSPTIKHEAAKKINANVRILIWEGMIAAIEFFNLYAIHRFLKADAEYQEIPNTLEEVYFSSPRILRGFSVRATEKFLQNLLFLRRDLGTLSALGTILMPLLSVLINYVIFGKSFLLL